MSFNLSVSQTPFNVFFFHNTVYFFNTHLVFGQDIKYKTFISFLFNVLHKDEMLYEDK